MQCYRVTGFAQADVNASVIMIVEADVMGGQRPSAIAQDIAGPDYCFVSSITISAVPDAAKNRLFFSNEELFAAVPELAPKPKQRRRVRGK
jgi:hypothetical protein